MPKGKHLNHVKGVDHVRYKHGHNSWITGPSRTYIAWHNLVQRCTNPKRKNYKAYKDRWYPPWADFNVFLADMGECPQGLTIERVDNNKPYGPNNCVWATRTEQMRNSSKTKLTAEIAEEIRQSKLSGPKLATHHGVYHSTIYRIKQGRIWK